MFCSGFSHYCGIWVLQLNVALYHSPFDPSSWWNETWQRFQIRHHLVLPATSPLCWTYARLAVPLALWRSSHPHTRVVEPFVGTVLVVARHHVPIGHLVADTVPRLVGIIVPLLVWALARCLAAPTKTCHGGRDARQGRWSGDLEPNIDILSMKATVLSKLERLTWPPKTGSTRAMLGVSTTSESKMLPPAMTSRPRPDIPEVLGSFNLCWRTLAWGVNGRVIEVWCTFSKL